LIRPHTPRYMNWIRADTAPDDSPRFKAWAPFALITLGVIMTKFYRVRGWLPSIIFAQIIERAATYPHRKFSRSSGFAVVVMVKLLSF